MLLVEFTRRRHPRVGGCFSTAASTWAIKVGREFRTKDVSFFVVGSMIQVLGIYVFNRFSKRAFFNVNGRNILYLLLVLILGAGLIVNVIFKDDSGRARPRDITEFGGSEQFTPAFVVTSGCVRSCSFSSGDSAGASCRGVHDCGQQETRDRHGRCWVCRRGFLFEDRFRRAFHLRHRGFVFIMLLVSDALYFYMFLWSRAPIADESVARPGI